MFFLKKFLSLFILPLPLSLILALMGLFLLWFSERKKAGKVLVSIGSLSLLLMSTGIIAKLLLVPLERQYPPVLTASTIAGQDGQPVKWIVVLGGGGSYNSQLPSTSLLSNASLARLIEGIRLQRQISGKT